MAEIITNIADNEEISIRKHRYTPYPVPYYFGIVEENKLLDDTGLLVSAIDQFEKMSYTDHWLLWKLIKVRKKDSNIAVFRAKGSVESQKVSKAYNGLNLLNLVQRIKRQHYLINPNAFLPYHKEYARIVLMWNDLIRVKELNNG